MADFSWMPIAAAFVSAAGTGLLSHLSNTRIAGKTEGVITTKIDAIGDRLDRHEEDNNRRFEDVKDAIDEEKEDRRKAFESLDNTDKKQWDAINAHGNEISYLKAKVNGKPAVGGAL